MAGVQSSYDRYAPIAQAGTPATTSGWDADTRNAEGTISFGVAVSKGVEDDGAVEGGSLFIGVSIRDITLVHDTVDQYEQYDDVAVLVRGDIWVEVEDAVVAQTAVKYATSGGQLGSSGGTTITNAVWMTSADAGDLAICRLGATTADLTT